jgi:hypothetical protein
MKNESKTITNSEYKKNMLAKLGIKESDLGTKKANNVKSPKAIVKDIAHTKAIDTLRTNEDINKQGTMKYIFAIGLKNNKPQELNGEYFVIDNVIDDKGQKGHLVLEYKSYFENTFVLDYQELGK